MQEARAPREGHLGQSRAIGLGRWGFQQVKRSHGKPPFFT